MSDFGKAERQIEKLFVIGQSVDFQGKTYNVELVGKPRPIRGEAKTDIYILLRNQDGDCEIKISYKKNNADFLENKIKSERAEQIFGDDWRRIIQDSIMQIQKRFENKKLIFRSSCGRTKKGAITLGWKFELMNKPSGELSGKIIISHQQYKDVLSGSNLSDSKRNSCIDKQIIPNSGVANYILTGENFSDAQDVLNHLESIDAYIQRCPDIYFACKALNYRTFERKFDGDRSLAVQVAWSVIDRKLVPILVFDKPLESNGNFTANQLKDCLTSLNINTTDDINEHNALSDIIYE